ncbi:ABC transporter permease [Hoeflea sp. TYP-13]|uniref:ABC transporter permease n=1 Tax=Hoeflea sp. TYP-13 TaxID=3230023 RepID=UPI0034C5B39D
MTHVTSAPAARTSFSNRIIAVAAKPEALGAAILIVVVLAFQALSGGILLSPYNVSNVLAVLPEIGLVVIGVSILMIAGEFDLSVGSVFALTPMIAFTLAESGLPISLTLAIAMACSLIVGFINGYITQVYRLPSFITTLGMLFVVRSITVSVSDGFPPPFAADAPTFLFSDFIGPVRVSMIWFFLLFALAAFGLKLTNYGLWVYATGGQREVAKSVGINTFRVKMAAFMLCSALAGFAGLLQVFRLRSPLPSLGEGLELQVIAAAVIGGVALTGGVGSVIGAVLGLLLLKVIENGLILVGVEANWFKFATGSIMIVAVILHASIAKYAKTNAAGDDK